LDLVVHASFASITTEVDVDPTLVMLGVAFEDEADEDDAPTLQVAPPSELLEPIATPIATSAAQKVFVLELLPLQPTLPMRVARAVLRWAPFAALGATGGLLLCIGASALANAVSAPHASTGGLHVTSQLVVPAAVAPAATALRADAVIELDETRAPDTIARRTRPTAVRPIVRSVTPASPVTRPPPLAAMPAEYLKGR
jgi:hypothetical protein